LAEDSEQRRSELVDRFALQQPVRRG
jgi:hypothetical protein